MSEKSKNKIDNTLPYHVENALIIGFMSAGILSILLIIGVQQIFNRSFEYLPVFVNISGLIIGWWYKSSYINKNGNNTQKIEVKAQFWGWIAYGISFIVTLSLVIYFARLCGIYLARILPPDMTDFSEATQSIITLIVGIPICIITFGVAYSTKQRVYKNFGYKQKSE